VATDDTVKLTINRREWIGWTSIRVTRGIERMPGDFQLTLTEQHPDEPTDLVFKPGDPCILSIGNDDVITGYIDRWMPTITPTSHTITITGRGKCQDLVDCSAKFDGNQIQNTNALDLANKLAGQFGLTAISLVGPGRSIGQFVTNLTESAWVIIQRVANFSGLLVYEDRTGNLIFNHVGTEQHASGFEMGVNIQAASVSFAMDERFSEITAVISAVDGNWQLHADATAGGVGLSDALKIITVKDPTVPRYRPRVVVSESGPYGIDLARDRALWEMARRRGRSQAVTLTCDSWRDSDGVLWEPNKLASLDIPQMKLGGKTWIIAEVTYSVDPAAGGRGQTADVTLMPKDAFSPQPTLLYPFDWQVSQDLNGTPAPTTKTNAP
jgi:prophage tail gpP-like protein